MDNLEKYISENRIRFDEEPVDGHFERLQQKIEQESSNKRIKSIRWVLSIAASITILYIVGSIVFQKTEKINEFCEVAIDMKICYLEKMYLLADQIEELIVDFDQWDRQLVMSDVNDIIETVNGDFESEIPEELSDEIAKILLSGYYRQNLESLEMIVESIKN